jgi:hypothetical protein
MIANNKALIVNKRDQKTREEKRPERTPQSSSQEDPKFPIHHNH